MFYTSCMKINWTSTSDRPNDERQCVVPLFAKSLPLQGSQNLFEAYLTIGKCQSDNIYTIRISVVELCGVAIIVLIIKLIFDIENDKNMLKIKVSVRPSVRTYLRSRLATLGPPNKTSLGVI